MARFNQINPETATGKTQELLSAVKAKMGMVPNMTRAMANSPAVLESYLQFAGALGNTLTAKQREQIALATAEANGCDYCLSAHSTIGKMVGLSAEQIHDAREGIAVDAKTDAVLNFASKVAVTHGKVEHEDLQRVRAAGFEDGQIAEIVANVALNVFTNYFNNVAETDIDFPKAAPLAKKEQATA